MQVLAQAVEATGAFGSNGEWREPRVLQVQFQGIVGHDAHQFKNGSRQVVVSPSHMASGTLMFPYARAV